MNGKKNTESEADLTPREIAFISGQADTDDKRIERAVSTVLSIGDEDRRVGSIRVIKSRS